jgi:hypothetical protein
MWSASAWYGLVDTRARTKGIYPKSPPPPTPCYKAQALLSQKLGPEINIFYVEEINCPRQAIFRIKFKVSLSKRGRPSQPLDCAPAPPHIAAGSRCTVVLMKGVESYSAISEKKSYPGVSKKVPSSKTAWWSDNIFSLSLLLNKLCIKT